MVSVRVKNNNIEKYLKIFSSEVYMSGILQEYKNRQEYKKPSEIKREKRKISKQKK